jgi:hypothetical protein
MSNRIYAKEFAPRGLCALLIVLLALAPSGCYRSTPPGAAIAGGKVGDGGFTFLRWKQGLAIMIWHDLDSCSNRGAGTAGDPIYRLTGFASSLDGRRVSWQVQTMDGKTGQLWIDDMSYDLAAGTLFIVTTRNGPTHIQQLYRDLSGVRPDYESCVAFARGDPDLARMIDGLSDAQAEATIARLTELAGKDLQARFDLERKDILVTSIRPLEPICRGLEACTSNRPGYVIQLTVADRLYEYRARILDQKIVLWREVQSEPVGPLRHETV